MAVEKMHMVDLVGDVNQFDRVTKLLVLLNNFEPVDAFQQINSSNFYISTNETNMDAILNVSQILPVSNSRDYSEVKKHLNEIISAKASLMKESEGKISPIWNQEEIVAQIENLYKEYKDINEKLQNYKHLMDDYQKLSESLDFLSEVDVNIEELNNLKNFSWGIYKISRENREKLKRNYENIPSIIITIYTTKDYKIILTFTPNLLLKEANNIFRSANCEPIPNAMGFNGTPKEAVQELRNLQKDLENEVKILEEEQKAFIKENSKKIDILEASLDLELQSNAVKGKSAIAKDFFYISGWVPESEIKKITRNIEKIDEQIIIIDKSAETLENSNLKAPTRLKNNFFVKPFESMVRMYGMPSYGEIDPTAFLSISYLLLFGAMFGDLGQGLIFALAGLFISKKMKRVNLGGVFTRLGISSMIFGTLYGSVFGFETVIPALLIRPMEDIMDVLIGAVVFGCVLLIVGYILGLINAYRRRDIEHGLFGKDGLAGLLFFLTVLGLILSIFLDINILPTGVFIALLVILLLMIFLKEPLTNLVSNNRPLFHDSPGSYFVEAIFEIIETLLSMFSNTLSFIRVGAFAINHVGLFLAFEALAHMMNGAVGSIFMYILGNIMIIGLEGLIVFIQGLRLEYYELFSKYYSGSGVPFTPVSIKYHERLSISNEEVNLI
ncbi:MAG: V-type ATP synthase subunit I [Clostridiaceae bacterium]